MKKHIFYNPIMLAVLAFLFISLVLHLLSLQFGWRLESWDRIVAATTISSYFFAGSSLSRFMIEREEKSLNSYEKYSKKYGDLLYLTEICYKLNSLDVPQDLIEESESIKQEYAKQKKTSTHYISILKNVNYLVNALVALSFLIVISYESIYSKIIEHLDVYTILAFFIALLIEYASEKIENNSLEHEKDITMRIDNLYIRQKELLNRTITHFNDTQEGQYGQDEDAE